MDDFSRNLIIGFGIGATAAAIWRLMHPREAKAAEPDPQPTSPPADVPMPGPLPGAPLHDPPDVVYSAAGAPMDCPLSYRDYLAVMDWGKRPEGGYVPQMQLLSRVTGRHLTEMSYPAADAYYAAAYQGQFPCGVYAAGVNCDGQRVFKQLAAGHAGGWPAYPYGPAPCGR